MWQRLKNPLFALSLGLNAAFIAIWLIHAAPGFIAGQPDWRYSAETGPDELHRKIGVTPAQWQEIEPHIRNFRKKAQIQQHAIKKCREELMALLAAPAADDAAIRQKQEDMLAGKRAMQDLVIDLLLKEKKILTIDQQRDLIKAIQRSCNCDGAANSGSARPGTLLMKENSPAGKGNTDQ